MVLTSVKYQYSGKRLRHLHAFQKMPSKDFRADGAGLILIVSSARPAIQAHAKIRTGSKRETCCSP